MVKSSLEYISQSFAFFKFFNVYKSLIIIILFHINSSHCNQVSPCCAESFCLPIAIHGDSTQPGSASFSDFVKKFHGMGHVNIREWLRFSLSLYNKFPTINPYTNNQITCIKKAYFSYVIVF